MKIRTSFVTNSSSSSFIVVGISSRTKGYNELYATMVKDMEVYDDQTGEYRKPTLEEIEEQSSKFDYYDCQDKDFEFVTTDNYGENVPEISIRTDFENKSVNQMKQEFVEKAKLRGVDIDLKSVHFDYGAYYDG